MEVPLTHHKFIAVWEHHTARPNKGAVAHQKSHPCIPILINNAVSPQHAIQTIFNLRSLNYRLIRMLIILTKLV